MGELIKNNQEKWCFYIDSLQVYQNELLSTKPKVEELQIIINTLSNDIKYDSYLQPFNIICKQFYDCNQIDLLINKIIPSLKYNCKGLYFHNNKTKEKIFYYFKHVIPFAVSNTKTINQESNQQKQHQQNQQQVNNSNKIIDNKVISKIKNIKFKIVKTMQIDVYKLYLQKKTKEYKKFSYVHIPDISTSQFLQNYLKRILIPLVECKLCHNFLNGYPLIK